MHDFLKLEPRNLLLRMGIASIEGSPIEKTKATTNDLLNVWRNAKLPINYIEKIQSSIDIVGDGAAQLTAEKLFTNIIGTPDIKKYKPLSDSINSLTDNKSTGCSSSSSCSSSDSSSSSSSDSSSDSSSSSSSDSSSDSSSSSSSDSSSDSSSSSSSDSSSDSSSSSSSDSSSDSSSSSSSDSSSSSSSSGGSSSSGKRQSSRHSSKTNVTPPIFQYNLVRLPNVFEILFNYHNYNIDIRCPVTTTTRRFNTSYYKR